MKKLVTIALLMTVMLTACAPTSTPTTQPYPSVPETPPLSAPTPTLPAPIEPYPVPTPATLTPAQTAAVQALAQLLGLSPDAIRIVRTEAVNWPDGCLGIARPGLMCTTAIVPGFRIVLEVGGTEYEYRTNETGSQVVASPQDSNLTSAPALAAREALAQALGVDVADVTVLATQLVSWMDSCLGVRLSAWACADVETPGALVILQANGQFYEYHTNTDGSAVVPATVALTWHREGGIAGFCDDLIVYAAGEVRAWRCNGGGAAIGQLTTAEWKQFDEWLTQYSAVALSHSDGPTVADGMTLALTLNGYGSAQPSEAEQEALWAWAQAVYARLVP